MAEPDVFERRLRAALVRHTDGGPTDFDALAFAREVAAKEPRRRGLATALGWRMAGIPRLAWVLLLLAVLLAATIGGALFVGSRKGPSLRAVLPPIGQVFVCPAGSTPDKAAPIDQARPAFTETVAFDRRAGTLVAVTGSLSGVETWTFDVCTNTWTQRHPNREPPGFEWARLVYDVDSDVTILIAYSADPSAWAYNLEADAWTLKGSAPAYAVPVAYDPRSGLVVVTADDRLWDYDVERDVWIPIEETSPAPARPAVYDASVDRLIAYSDPVWLFDPRTGTWASSGAGTPTVIAGYGMQPPQIVYDEAAERTAVFGNGRWVVYDATAERWEILERGSTAVYADGVDLGEDHPSYWGPVAYDPVNRRLVCWGRDDDAGQGGVAALDLASREWTVLLAPNKGQATP